MKKRRLYSFQTVLEALRGIYDRQVLDGGMRFHRLSYSTVFYLTYRNKEQHLPPTSKRVFDAGDIQTWLNRKQIVQIPEWTIERLLGYAADTIVSTLSGSVASESHQKQHANFQKYLDELWEKDNE